MRIFSKITFVVLSSLCLLVLSTSVFASSEQSTSNTISNQLKDHPSPYLALHGNDPVAWQDWHPDVLKRAKAENKLILLSSGYFSCHWCHVMQRESYQNADVAELLNALYIPVKIDRELEPALDKRLMAYAQATIKQGGWPLNVFMSPDGIPVFAILYQPQAQFHGLLERLSGLWEKQSDRIRKLALVEKTPVGFADAEPKLDANLATELRTYAVQQIMARGDSLQGGFGQVNKFPSVPQLSFLLDSLEQSRDPEVIEFLDTTLAAMADNGMQDHLQGGFFRYSVDPGWEIPHFEKMLYDNANLAGLYLKAGQILNNTRYTSIARTTLDFMAQTMSNADGILYASFSAVDSEDIEGGYYLWQSEEIKEHLNQAEYETFAEAWHIERSNDFESGNHLRDVKSTQEIGEILEKSETEIQTLLASAKTKLIKQRMTRILPTDDKLLAGWNGLALSAFSAAAKRINDPRYRQQAEKIRTFIIDTLWQGDHLARSLSKNRLIGSASIEDYAFVARGLLDWAKLTEQEADFQQAEKVLEQGWHRFYQNNAWSYADTSLLPPEDGQEILPEDSSNSPSASIIQSTISLFNAGKLQNKSLFEQALSALNRGEDTLRHNPFWYVSQITAMQSVN